MHRSTGHALIVLVIMTVGGWQRRVRVKPWSERIRPHPRSALRYTEVRPIWWTEV